MKIQNKEHLRNHAALPDPLAQMLDAEARNGPSAEQLARMAAKIGIAPPPMPSSPPPAASAAGAGGALIPWIGVGVIAVAIGLGGGVWLTREPDAPAPVAPPQSRAIEAPAAEPIAAPVEPAVPRIPENTPAPEARRSQPRRPHVERAPAQEETAPVTPPAPIDEADRFRQETLLIRRAESLLANDPLAALRTANEHRRDFPDGELGQEREVIAIDALLRVGSLELAEARARSFLLLRRGSPHALRVERLLAQYRNRNR